MTSAPGHDTTEGDSIVPDQANTKRCTKCGAVKPILDFSTNGKKPSRLAQCKPCKTAAASARYWGDHANQQTRSRENARLHAEKNRANHRNWLAANKDHVRQYAREYRQAHLDEIRARSPRYNEANRRAAAVRRSRKKQVPSEHIAIETLAQRDGWNCAICRKAMTLRTATFDHIIPLSHGGPFLEWNLQLAHKSCNSRRGAARIPGQPRLAI